MKLSCPNCAAQYEVPDEVIPETGRDVQCSACGDTWFQVHPDHPEYQPTFDPDAPEEGFNEDGLPEAAEEKPEPEPEPEYEPEPEHASEYEPEEEQEPEEDYDFEDAEESYDHDEDELDEDYDEDQAHSAPRRELPEEVTSVLKEEAELESRAREAEMAGGLETQPELGLAETQELERRTREAKARMARLRGFDDAKEEPVSDLVQHPDPDTPTAPQEPEIDLGSRANLLPQVEDVDQKIESQNEGAAEASAARDGSRVATQKEGGGGFRQGMRLSVILAMIGSGLYFFSPQLAQMVPGLEGPLSSYAQLIDQGRAALQQLVGQ